MHVEIVLLSLSDRIAEASEFIISYSPSAVLFIFILIGSAVEVEELDDSACTFGGSIIAGLNLPTVEVPEVDSGLKLFD